MGRDKKDASKKEKQSPALAAAVDTEETEIGRSSAPLVQTSPANSKFRIAVIGDKGVGKRSLVKRFVDKEYSESNYQVYRSSSVPYAWIRNFQVENEAVDLEFVFSKTGIQSWREASFLREPKLYWMK